MADFDGRVIAITGAGRGLGREHALLLGGMGARLVINDLGATTKGDGLDASPAEDVAAAVRDLGGQAIVNGDDVSSWAGGQRLVDDAIAAFGQLDGLVNNAGILRDAMLVNLSEDDWDRSIAVNLKGHVAPARAAAAHWRDRAKRREQVAASIVNTASESGAFGNVGQSNYNAAKSGVVSLTETWAKELIRYGARVNAMLPRARTRLTEGTFGTGGMQANDGEFDAWHPGNVSPLVAYLLTLECELNGHVFVTGGGLVQRVKGWSLDNEWKLKQPERWTVNGLAAAIGERGAPSNADRNTGFIR